MRAIRTYTELSKLKTFEERFAYLKLSGSVGAETFGFDRYLNQCLYTSGRWRKVRDKIIVRDCGCDLGVEGYELIDHILVHHMNPLTVEDVIECRSEIFDPEFLICCGHDTHNAIHYGTEKLLSKQPITRFAGDTKLW